MSGLPRLAWKVMVGGFLGLLFTGAITFLVSGCMGACASPSSAADSKTVLFIREGLYGVLFLGPWGGCLGGLEALFQELRSREVNEVPHLMSRAALGAACGLVLCVINSWALWHGLELFSLCSTYSVRPEAPREIMALFCSVGGAMKGWGVFDKE